MSHPEVLERAHLDALAVPAEPLLQPLAVGEVLEHLPLGCRRSVPPLERVAVLVGQHDRVVAAMDVVVVGEQHDRPGPDPLDDPCEQVVEPVEWYV